MNEKMFVEFVAPIVLESILESRPISPDEAEKLLKKAYACKDTIQMTRKYTLRYPEIVMSNYLFEDEGEPFDESKAVELLNEYYEKNKLLEEVIEASLIVTRNNKKGGSEYWQGQYDAYEHIAEYLGDEK